jgi:hypothetical protein
VLNSFQYQDKEVRKKSKRNEENTFKDSVLELSDFYNSAHCPSDHKLFYDVCINEAAVEI